MSSLASYLDPVQLRRDLGLRDLSEPAEGPHAVQILIGQAVEGLCRAWDCELRWCSGPRIVPVADNYDRLGYPAEAITRDARYTRYVDAGNMLRSHSSAMIPPALRRLARQPGDDVLLVCPGIVYRRDAIDWQHAGTPHQLDLWRITRRAMSSTDMDQMIAILLGALAPGRPHRQQPRTHPYTLDGRQVDVYHDGRWVEVWECGLAHPSVLTAAGLPGRSGLALGMGLDRLLMLVKRIPDIRLLRSAIPGSPARCSTSPGTSMSRRCPQSPGTCPSLSPGTRMRKLSVTGSAMPSAPTRAVSRRSGCCPPPRTSSCPRQREAVWERYRGRRTFSCASSSGIWKRHSQTRPPTPSVTGSTGRFIKERNTSGPNDPR